MILSLLNDRVISRFWIQKVPSIVNEYDLLNLIVCGYYKFCFVRIDYEWKF